MYYYSKKDIEISINKLNLNYGDVVYISGSLLNFGIPSISKIDDLSKLFFNFIKKKIGKNGTIAVPTHTFNLVNNKKIFNPLTSKCMTGSLSNFIIKKKNSYRQPHPYASILAIGPKAKEICNSKDIDVYGPNCPFKKLVNFNAKFLSLGLPINENCTQVHLIEKEFNVPYRYNKEFYHKIIFKKKIKRKLFTMFVLKEKHRNFKRNKNKIIIKNFLKTNIIQTISLGSNQIYLYDLKKFYKSTKNLFKKNIYAWSGKEIY